MAKIDHTYRDGLKEIIDNGYVYEDPNREGVFRTEVQEMSFKHSFEDGFPAITTKEAYFKGAIGELLMFLSGSTDIRDLWKFGVRFWDKDWARFKGYSEKEIPLVYQAWKKGVVLSEDTFDMGKIYPKQYRDFGGVDQLINIIETLKTNPMSTSLIVNAWNPSELKLMCLPPCHYGFQVTARPLSGIERYKLWYKNNFETGLEYNENANINFDDSYYTTTPKYGFTVHWQQRSTDYFLGTPVNVMYYALLALILEKLTGHKALGIQGDLKNVHLYDNQVEAALEQLGRDPKKYGSSYVKVSEKIDRLVEHLDSGAVIVELVPSMFELRNYESYPPLKVEMLSYKNNGQD